MLRVSAVTLAPFSAPPRGKLCSPHLRDNGLVLFNSLPFFFTAHDVGPGQRQRLPVPTENRLALAYISRGQGEGSPWVHGVMLDMTEDSSTSKFLPSSSKFPGIQRAGVTPGHNVSHVSFADSTGEPGEIVWGSTRPLSPKQALLDFSKEKGPCGEVSAHNWGNVTFPPKEPFSLIMTPQGPQGNAYFSPCTPLHIPPPPAWELKGALQQG